MSMNERLNPEHIFDLIVIGGGITGAGTARDAALRGLSCLLLEKEDFASGVTSKTTRLIHGGLRYLANFEVDLVAESLRERAILRRMAPYLIRPIPLIIPIYKGDPHGRAVISLGIHLYDILSHDHDIPHYFTSGREKTLSFEPRLNQDGLSGSALFYDHQIMMPERLVMENIVSARAAGAAIRNHMRADSIKETERGVVVTARDALTGQAYTFRSKLLINAAGPWIDSVRRAGNIDQKKIIYPTKGIHLVMRRLSDQALFVTSRDGRMFFIVPLGDYSLIGTTDTRYNGHLDNVHADREDVDYLLTESRRILPGLNITRASILYTYAGVRPLAFAGSSESKISRKHRVIPEGRTGRIITIAGGKLTTYRNMAKDVVDQACRVLGVNVKCLSDKKRFTGGLPMPYEDYMKKAVPDMAARHNVAQETVRHLTGFYGSRADRVLDLVDKSSRLGRQISPESRDIYAQVVYGVLEEGARTLPDIVLRRMHLGMTGTRGRNQIENIAEVAAGELKWSAEETRQQVDNFKRELDKNTECLKSYPA
jgi:glycerol-3-phosphate dehydrogenase